MKKEVRIIVIAATAVGATIGTIQLFARSRRTRRLCAKQNAVCGFSVHGVYIE